MATETLTPAADHDLAHNLRRLRKRMGISQEELAHRLGLNRGNIASYENGTAEPKLCNLLRMSDLFGVSIHDLTCRDMSCDRSYQQAYSSYLRLNSEEAVALKDFEQQCKDLKEVFTGIVRCYEFLAQKAAKHDPELRMLDAQFHQVRQLSQDLFAQHEELLVFVRTRLRS